MVLIDPHDPQAICHAEPEVLSLALLDARNGLLRRLTQYESPRAVALALRAGIYQEHWIGGHVQRWRGEACDAAGTRLGSVDAALLVQAARPQAQPDELAVQRVRDYLAKTLEITLDLLALAPPTEAALHFFHQSLLHEDRINEALDERLGASGPPPRRPLDAIVLPAQCWSLGSTPGGWVPAPERWAHEVAVPAFEIDAQALNWRQYTEFCIDAGYSTESLWGAQGWRWLQSSGQRAPLHARLEEGRIRLRQGEREWIPSAHQAVTGVSRFEAQAFAHWAGRRLPTEAEWELSASRAVRLGFAWGDVLEWVAGSASAYPSASQEGAADVGSEVRADAPGALDLLQPAHGQAQGVLRGASHATPARRRHAKARRFAPLTGDDLFCGFRTCAL